MISRRVPAATAQDEAYMAILDGIRAGRYQPGERLIPEHFAQELAMSRMPVREAFQRLANEGLVLIRPNRGCVVSGLTIDEIVENFEMRSVLEGLAVRLAMERVDETVLAELDDHLMRMELSGLAGGADWLTLHQAFHIHICALAGRPKLLRQVTALHIAVEPYLRIWLHHVDQPRTATRTQHVVVDAMRTGDAAFAETTMREHVMRTVPRLVEFLRPGASPGRGRARAPLPLTAMTPPP